MTTVETNDADSNESIDTDGMAGRDGGDAVGVAIRGDAISGRVYLDAEAATEVAERLATVAGEVGNADE